MKHRFLVGEVAKLFQLSASKLRYYDEIGIFRPAYTDPDTSYRHYTMEQFPVLDTIIFLQKNGFSIKDIKKHLAERSPENAKELLERKLREVEKETERLKQVTEKIKSKIATIDEGISLRANPSLIYRWFPERAVSYLYNDTPIDLMKELDALYLNDMKELSLIGVNYDGFFTGDFGSVVELDSLYEEGPLKYRAVFEVLHQQKEGLETFYLDGGMYACYPHFGPYESIKATYQLILDLVGQDGCQITGNPLELAMLDESVTDDQKAYITWIQIPVQRND